MAKFFDKLEDKHSAFIAEQKMFCVASAPSEGGHVNLSPKGGDTFRVISPSSACYLDLTGSGNETAAHLLDNGRLTVMFTSFEANALILRLYGKGSLVSKTHEDWAELSALFPQYPGIRQIMKLDIDQVQSSCGYQVPVMTFVKERETLTKYALNKGEDAMKAYRTKENQVSMDGLPTGLTESD